MSCSEIKRLREEGKLIEAYKLALAEYESGLAASADVKQISCEFFWVCVDMIKHSKEHRNGTDMSILTTLHALFNDVKDDTPLACEAYGWSLARVLADNVDDLDSLTSRKMMAEYMKLSNNRPSRLHSYMLTIATKMAELHPDFKFLPFLKMWDIRNLQPRSDEQYIDEKTGRKYPSLLEKMARAYMFSTLYDTSARTAGEEYGELRDLLYPLAKKKGYRDVVTMVATMVTTSNIKGRKVTFVKLVAADGTEASAEVHQLTRHQRIRYDDIPNTFYDVLLREKIDDESVVRVEGVVPHPTSGNAVPNGFECIVGYVEHIDVQHGHIHVYDSLSRHFVAKDSRWHLRVGQYVEFVPVVPKESKFKSAVIRRLYSESTGPTAFGFRKAKITYADSVKGYCSWELMGDEKPVVEQGTTEPSYTKGYLSQQLLQSKGLDMPKVGEVMNVIVFLKRGKDGVKRPYVVDFFKV